MTTDKPEDVTQEQPAAPKPSTGTLRMLESSLETELTELGDDIAALSFQLATKIRLRSEIEAHYLIHKAMGR